MIPTTHGDRDESALIKKETLVDNDHERTTTVEYCLVGCDGQAHRTGMPDAPSYFCAKHVHRSVAVHIKEWPSANGAIGSFG